MTTMTASYAPIRTARRIDGVTYAVRDVVALARQAEAAGKKIIGLNIGDPCQFDFRTPELVVEAIVKALRDNKTSYSASEGIPEAREAIRRDAEERKGIRVGPGRASSATAPPSRSSSCSTPCSSPARPCSCPARAIRSTPPCWPRSAAGSSTTSSTSRTAGSPTPPTSSGWWTPAPAPWC